MEIHTRRPKLDHENMYAVKGKESAASLVKKQGLSGRGALGELNANVKVPREVTVGKVAVAAAEYEKKTNVKISKSNYSHVSSKVDSGRAIKTTVQSTCRPTLRREESTGYLAGRAAAIKTKVVLKESKLRQNDKENINVQSKKVTQEKKVFKSILTKDTTKDKNSLKPSLKEPTESLGKLKLADASKKYTTSTINLKKLKEVALPKDIEDIDSNDDNNPLLLAEYIKDIYKYLCELEEKYSVKENFLEKQNDINSRMRATLVDWLVEVHQQFTVTLETLQLTIGIIDRYLQTDTHVMRNELQLVGITAMFIASKYEEIYPPSIQDFIYVTDQAYTIKDVKQCERDILCKLQFCLARPIPLNFLRRFVKAANGTSKNHHLAKYFVDLCLVEYSMAHYRPSELSAAAVCLSLHVLSSKNLADVWTPALRYYSNYSLDQIVPIIIKIACIVSNAKSCRTQAVYVKYSSPTLAEVSKLPQLKGEAINRLAKMAASPGRL